VQTGQSSRERKANMREAMTIINKRLDDMESAAMLFGQNQMRRGQVGSGMRGDKRRTYRFREDSVYDSICGKEARCSEVMKGMFELLW